MSMNVEDLNKSQIILLALLASFVTSIATGIVTVSLMEKAPKDVVRVVQKVVEHTVERVEKVADTKSQPKEKIVVHEKTVVVKEGDLIAQAIAANRQKMVGIYEKESGNFVAFGCPVSSKHIITDSGALSDGKNYYVKTASSKKADLKYVKGGGARGLAMFELVGDTVKLNPIDIAKNQAKLGQSIFIFTDGNFNSVKQGIVSGNKESLILIDANLSDIPKGMMIFNSVGEVLGISTEASRSINNEAFIPASAIMAFYKAPKEDNATNNKDENNQNTEGVATSTNQTGNQETSNATTTNNTLSNNGADSQTASAGNSTN